MSGTCSTHIPETPPCYLLDIDLWDVARGRVVEVVFVSGRGVVVVGCRGFGVIEVDGGDGVIMVNRGKFALAAEHGMNAVDGGGGL